MAETSSVGLITLEGESPDKHCNDEELDEAAPGSGESRGTTGPGLEVRDLPDGTRDSALLGRITSGTCSFTGTAFRARGSGSGYRFEMRIAGARDVPHPQQRLRDLREAEQRR